MVYRWNLDGTALEFPTPYKAENRFLTLRGYALVALSLLVFAILTFVEEAQNAKPGLELQALPEPASVWPHALGALFMAGWGVMNLMQASRQRALLMVPGQPASLMHEVAHEATGASPRASWLTQAVLRGVVLAPKLSGPYAAWLARLSPEVASAPNTLLAYLRVRLSHLLLLLTMAAVLGAVAGFGLVLGRTGAADMAAVVVGLVLSLVLVRHAVQPDDAAWSPWAVAALAALGLLVAAPLGWVAQSLPLAEMWPLLGLPGAVSLALVLGIVLELVALLAARRQLLTPRPVRSAVEEANVPVEADLMKLFGEVDRELFRRWAEGIPNRRYTRQPPVVDPAAQEGSFSAVVLEESQPLVPPPMAVPGEPVGSTRWLWVLGVAGLLLTAAGGLLWAWLALTQMRDSTSAWVPATLGLVCLLMGGYALAMGHLLWSRMEAGSTITWLELKGGFFKVQAVPAPSSQGPRRAPAELAAVDAVSVKACVVHTRSVFYAAASHGVGSRSLVAMAADPGAAAAWISSIQNLARNANLGAAAASPAVTAARARSREQRAAAAEGAVPKRPARFCSACGTPLIAGARFCQQCGSTVTD
jgi:hypothetical protein